MQIIILPDEREMIRQSLRSSPRAFNVLQKAAGLLNITLNLDSENKSNDKLVINVQPAKIKSMVVQLETLTQPNNMVHLLIKNMFSSLIKVEETNHETPTNHPENSSKPATENGEQT